MYFCVHICLLATICILYWCLYMALEWKIQSQKKASDFVSFNLFLSYNKMKSRLLNKYWLNSSVWFSKLCESFCMQDMQVKIAIIWLKITRSLVNTTVFLPHYGVIHTSYKFFWNRTCKSDLLSVIICFPLSRLCEFNFLCSPFVYCLEAEFRAQLTLRCSTCTWKQLPLNSFAFDATVHI